MLLYVIAVKYTTLLKHGKTYMDISNRSKQNYLDEEDLEDPEAFTVLPHWMRAPHLCHCFNSHYDVDYFVCYCR